MRPLLVAATCLLPFACTAVETDYHLRDIRVLGGLMPGSGDIDATYGSGGTTTSGTIDGFGMGPRASVGFFESFAAINRGGGWFLGLTLNYGEMTADAQSPWPEIDATMVTLDGHVGYALPISRRLHIEGRAFFGGGSVKITEHNAVTVFDGDGNPIGTDSQARSSGSGAFWEGGIAGGAWYTFLNGIQLGLDAGLHAYRGEADVEYIGGDRDTFEFTGVGPFAQVGAGLRF